MLQFLESDRIRANVATLAAQAGVPCIEPRGTYFRLLDAVQRVGLFPQAEGPRALWQLEHPELGDHARYFSNNLLGGEALERLPDTEEPERKLQAACRALEDYQPVARRAVQLLVGQVVMARVRSGEGGASAVDSLGTIWMRPGRTWSTEVWAESLWHETTHQALFLEELAHGLFAVDADAMSRPEAMVVSAVWPYANPRKEPRPLFRAFHSACVASELTRLFEWQGRGEQARAFLDGARFTLAGLRDRQHFLTDHGRHVLANLGQQLE